MSQSGETVEDVWDQGYDEGYKYGWEAGYVASTKDHKELLSRYEI